MPKADGELTAAGDALLAGLQADVFAERRRMQCDLDWYQRSAQRYREAVRQLHIQRGRSVRATARTLNLDESTVRQLLGRR